MFLIERKFHVHHQSLRHTHNQPPFHKKITQIYPILLELTLSSFLNRSSLFSKLLERDSRKLKKELAALYKDFTIGPQNPEPDIFRNQDIIESLCSNATCVKESEHKLMPENKCLIPVCAKPVKNRKKPKIALNHSPPAILEKIISLLSRHLLGLAVEVHIDVPSWIQR